MARTVPMPHGRAARKSAPIWFEPDSDDEKEPDSEDKEESESEDEEEAEYHRHFPL